MHLPLRHIRHCVSLFCLPSQQAVHRARSHGMHSPAAELQKQPNTLHSCTEQYLRGDRRPAHPTRCSHRNGSSAASPSTACTCCRPASPARGDPGEAAETADLCTCAPANDLCVACVLPLIESPVLIRSPMLHSTAGVGSCRPACLSICGWRGLRGAELRGGCHCCSGWRKGPSLPARLLPAAAGAC